MALEEQVLLDISDALNSVGQLETALTTAASLFATSLAESLNILDSLQVGTVDASEVTVAIDAAVAGAALAAIVTADASAIAPEVDAAVAASEATVPVHADAGAVAAEIDEAVATADTTFTVTADTSQAQADVADLGESASGSTGEVDTLSNSVETFSSVASAGTGNLEGLAGSVSNIGPGSAAAVTGVTALAGTTLALFHAASDADVADRRFAGSLGELAASVQDVRIGGLNEDLGTLATRTGNSREQLQLASARINDLGLSSGVAAPKVAETVQQIDLLAIRATTMNPTLGEAGDVADRMGNAFARGGKALAPFGISLSSAEINARALADTGKSTTAELTQFEKAAAGAAITTERLGDHLGTDINEGAQSAEIQIRSLKQEFVLTLVELGKPLLDPLVRGLREGEPLLVALATDLGQLAAAVLPLFAKGIEAIAPLVGGASVAFGLLLDVIGPVVDLIVSIPTPILTAVAAMAAIGPALSALPTLFFAVAGGVDAMVAGFGALVSPVGLIALTIGGLAAVFISQANEAKKAKQENQAYADQLGDTKKAIEDVIGAKVAEAFKAQSDAVTRAGTSFENLTKQVQNGRTGYLAFLDDLQRTGAISAETRRALESTNAEMGRGRAVGGALAAENLGLNASTQKLVGTFQDEQKAAAAAAKTQVELFSAESRGNAAAVSAVITKEKLKGTTIDYISVLRQVKPPLDAEAAGQDKAKAAADKHTEALKALDESLRKVIETQIGAGQAGIRLERAQLAVAEAARQLVTAQGAARDAVAQHGAASNEAKEAEDKLHGAELDVEESAYALAAAHLDAEAKTRGVTVAALGAETQQHFTAEAFRQTARTVGEDSDLGQRLIQTANKLDSFHPIDLGFNVDTSQADAAISRLQANLRSLHDNPTVINILTQDATGLPARMAGGPVTGGAPYVVGEKEPELFVPAVSGWVFNQSQQSQLREILNAMPQGQPGASVTNNYEVTVNEVAADPRATAFAVSSRIGQRARR